LLPSLPLDFARATLVQAAVQERRRLLPSLPLDFDKYQYKPQHGISNSQVIPLESRGTRTFMHCMLLTFLAFIPERRYGKRNGPCALLQNIMYCCCVHSMPTSCTSCVCRGDHAMPALASHCSRQNLCAAEPWALYLRSLVWPCLAQAASVVF